MIPVPQSKLAILKPLFEAALKETHLDKRTSNDVMLEKLKIGYDTRFMAAYVDSLESPKMTLVLANYPGLWMEESVAAVLLIYATPQVRALKSTLSSMREQMNSFAAVKKADTLVGGSILFRGARGIDSYWLNEGFEKQETSYVKFLA